MSTPAVSAEHQRILDNMLRERIESLRKSDADEVQAIEGCIAKGIMDATRLRCKKSPRELEDEALRQILISTRIHDQKEDDLMTVGTDGTKIPVRTIQVWASFHCTPERTQ